MGMVVKRFDTNLLSDEGYLISPNEMNAYIQTVILAPMTTKARDYPTRVSCRFEGKDAHIVLDQLRTIDKSRLIKRLGRINTTTQKHVLAVLAELFAE